MGVLKERTIRFVTGALLILSLLVSPLTALTAYAMNGKIAFSDPSAKVGEEVTVTMKVTSTSGEALGSAKIMLDYDESLLQFESGDNASGGAGAVQVKGQATTDKKEWVYNLKFKALKAGEAAVKVNSQEVYDVSQKLATMNPVGSSKVTIAAAAGSPTNAKLSSLTISPGVLSPAFSADVTDYKATVGQDVKKITVSAPAADGNAKVVISGNDDLQMGDNTVTCKVTAQDGTTVKTYTIKVTKQNGETPTAAGKTDNNSGQKVTINGTEYDIVSEFDEALLPEGYEKTTYTYKGTQVQGAINKGNQLMLLYLVGKGGKGDFFFYDDKTDTWSPYAVVNSSAKSITIVPLDANVAVPNGFKETTLNLNGKTIRGWVWESDTEQRYCVFYGMNKDGNKDFYRYDMKEKTIQRYFADPAIDTGISAQDYMDVGNKYESILKDYRQRGMVMLLLLIVAVASLIGLIIACIALKRMSARLSDNGENADGNSAKPTAAPEPRKRGLKDGTKADDAGKTASVTEKNMADADKTAPVTGKNPADAGKTAPVTGKSAADAGKTAPVTGKNPADVSKTASVSSKNTADEGTDGSMVSTGKASLDSAKTAAASGKTETADKAMKIADMDNMEKVNAEEAKLEQALAKEVKHVSDPSDDDDDFEDVKL